MTVAILRLRRRQASTPGPRMVSIWDPIHLGIDEYATPVACTLIYRHLLLAGEPGSGKSGGLNNVVAHAALSADCELWLMDGKRVELGLWRDCAARFIGSDLGAAIEALTELQAEMDRRYDLLDARRRRKIEPGDHLAAIMLVIDELAYYSATVGDKRQRETFAMLLRDVVARGRAAGVIVVVATQRPSSDIIPTSLRDLFGYRLAFRCTTDSSSDIVLGHGWAARGYDASAIDPTARGIGWLLAEGGIPRRMRCAYLTDEHITAVAARAFQLRHPPATRDPERVLVQVDDQEVVLD
ncbi:MAG: FtsK/SpoIIIE domain-containing protein, partial [Pseudonocardiaceae bacterium]